MSLPFGRGGRGLAMRLSAAPEEDKPDAGSGTSIGLRFGRGMPGRGLGLMKKPEETTASEAGRGRGLSIAPPAAPVGAQGDSSVKSFGRGLSLSIGRGIGRGITTTTPTDVAQKLAATSISEKKPDSGRLVSPQNEPDRKLEPRAERPNAPEGGRRRRMLEEVGPENKRGTIGSKSPMTANYIRLRCAQEEIYQYSVEFRPQIDARPLRMRIVMRLPADQFCGVPPEARAFDGRILCLPRPLSQRETVIRTVRPKDNAEIFIKIVLTNKTPIVSCPAAYNIIFRSIQQELKMTQVGRHYYDPDKKIDIGEHKLEVWPGYITTITAYEGGLLLMCDVSHKVIRKDTVHDLIKNIYQQTREESRFKQNCISQIVGQSVLTRYRNATYRIDDIDFKRHAQSTFQRNGVEISFASYFKEQYNITIKDPSQPLLLHRPKRFGRAAAEQGNDEPLSLIPELCYITGLTDEMRDNFRLMKALHEHTRVTPQVRHQAMRKFLATVNECQKARQILEAWGMSLETNTVSLEGRTLPPEKVKFGSGIIDLSRSNDANFKRELGRQKVLTPAPIESWVVICTSKDGDIVKEFLRTLQQRSRSVGMNIANPKVEMLRDDRTESYLRAMKSNITPETRMVLAVFPTKRTDRYNAFKKITCVECPVPSQVVITNTIRNPSKLASVATNIALQMNVKMGGELWAVQIPLKKFMVVGIDAYHQAKQRSQSVYGMCASVNGSCTRYYSRALFQEGRGQEIGDKIQSAMTDMLRNYYDTNNFLPDTIFFYRDGVGDSMLSTVQGYEIPQIIRGFRTFGENYSPKLVFNVVQKRINTRIFTPTGREMTNPKPGTIIDHTITRRDRYDFFLVPQSVNQGTVTPTHLVVLHDSSGLMPNEIQQMAYKQCHLYYNWPGTIRVPACCLYAHKLAYLVGQNIQKEPSTKLIDRLFFI